MVKALCQLSISKIFHRDLKPANILVDGEDPEFNPSENDMIILADFGIAKKNTL